jgi:Ca-activated chloride channel family protein
MQSARRLVLVSLALSGVAIGCTGRVPGADEAAPQSSRGGASGSVSPSNPGGNGTGAGNYPSPNPNSPAGYPAPSSGGASGGYAGASGGGSPSSGSADAGAAATGPDAGNRGDYYKNPGTNPFVMAAADPFSTFGVDVDTASYDIFRRDVNLGMLPRPDSVRLEEYVNAFDYAYPPPGPTDEAPFKVSIAAAGQVFDRPTLLFRVGIKGRQPPPVERRRANLVFLVDVSGSMSSPEKLPLVRKTLLETLEFLDPTDQVSIVTYAGDTRVRLAPTPVANASDITQVINGLESGGGTAGAKGLDLAYAQVAAGFIQGGINHVLLCTDGDFNIGPSSTVELVKLIRSKRNSGTTLTVLGYGVGNLNDDLMESVSDAGDGIYGVISDETQMRTYVHERLLSTLFHIAKDVKIQVEFNPERVLAYRLLGYENRAIADSNFRNDSIEAGEIGAGHKVTALYELVLAGGSVPAPRAGALVPAAPLPDTSAANLPREIKATDLALVKVRWKAVEATDATPAKEFNTALPASEIAESLMAADPDLRWAAAIAGFAEQLKQSPYADARGMAIIKDVVMSQSERDADRREFALLFSKAAALAPGP